MSQREGADVIQGRRGSSVLDDDDLLWEILLHLSPQPSSLPRASAVCKRWRRLATDARFLRQFYQHHRKPPLLGVFQSHEDIVFTPVLDPPNRIPSVCFNLGQFSAGSYFHDLDRLPNENHLLGCRHGRILIADYLREEVIVCDPITGEQFPLAVPSKFWRGYFNGAVLCAADDQGHVHGACLSSPFKVVLVSMFRSNFRLLACVYSSEAGAWGNVISIDVPSQISHAAMPASLVGNALYWLCLPRDLILEFDLKKQSLAMIKGPPITKEFCSCQIIRAEDGAIGFAALSYPRFQIWQRNSNGQDVPTWVLSKNIEMHNILELSPQSDRGSKEILGYSEDTDEIFILVQPNLYMVQLKSMQSKKIHETNYISNYHPFTSFYAAGTPISRKCDGAKVLHDGLE